MSRRAWPRSRRRPRGAAIAYFGHGTTVATNALIQHRGARTGLSPRDGFRDLLEIGRQKRPDLYDLQADKPPPLVPRDLRLEVPERVRHDGSVEMPLDEDGVRDAARALREAGRRGGGGLLPLLASSTPRTRHARAAILEPRSCPSAFICASHEVAPEFREYERLSTAVVNAYLGPVMQRYIRRLRTRLRRSRHARRRRI